jgi:hypothetical protein
VLPARDIYPGFECFHPGSRFHGLKDYHIRIKEFIFTHKVVKSSRKYDPGYSSPDPDLDLLPIPDPGVKMHRFPDPQRCI